MNRVGDGSRGRYDSRARHDGKQSPALSGAPRQLTKDEIENMEPNKPTEPKRIVVDALPTTPDTIEDSLNKVREAVQSTLGVIHRKATRELQLLDEKELQSLNIISGILVRIKKLSDGEPIDPSKLSDAELAKLG